MKGTYDDSLLYAVSILLETDVQHHDRSIYHFLDLLGDVGGLFDALKGISSFILAIYFTIFGHPMQKYLLESVFKNNHKQDEK